MNLRILRIQGKGYEQFNTSGAQGWARRVFSSGAILFTLIAVDGTAAVPTSIGACIAVMFIMKIVGANLLRLILTFTGKEALAEQPAKGDAV